MGRFFEKLSGPGGRGLLLFSYLFLIINAYLIGKNARNSLFLSVFKSTQLPYVDISIAVLVGFVVAAYVWIGRRLSLRMLFAGSVAFFGSNALLIWWLNSHVSHRIVFPLFYVWVGIFGVLAPAQVWTLANYLLTTREAKRMYGVIGAGAILGNVSAGAFAKFIAKSYGAESLLLAMAGSLFLCAVMLLFVKPRAADGMVHSPVKAGPTGTTFLEGLRHIRDWPYLRSVATLIGVASFVTALTGWQFKAISWSYYPDKVQYSIFQGDFDFYTGIICLAVQLLVTSNLLRRFGIGPALLVVPTTVIFGSVALLLSGGLAAVIFLMGSDKTLRYSIDKSTAELLYLPVPSGVKLPVKSFIDTVIWRLGDGLCGVTVLTASMALSTVPAPQIARSLAVAGFLLALSWAAIAVRARRQYVTTLQENISQHRLDVERISAPVLDRVTADVLAQQLSSVNENDLIYALDLFEAGNAGTMHPAVRLLLDHESAEVRRRAIRIASSVGDKSVAPKVESLLRDPQMSVRTEALLYLARSSDIDPLVRLYELGDFPDFSVRAGVIAYLAQDGPRQNLETVELLLNAMINETGPDAPRTRAEAAHLIGLLGERFDTNLELLIGDLDEEVARQAIRAAGHIRCSRVIPALIGELDDPVLGIDACEALAGYGETAVGALGNCLANGAAPITVRRAIPDLLARIGTHSAAQALGNSFLECDATLRLKVFSALDRLHEAHPEVSLDREVAETMLGVEIMGHCRSYHILGALGGTAQDPSITAGMHVAMTAEQERIFCLLGLLFPDHNFHSVWLGLQSSDPVVHDNALELLDNILKPELRALLVPLLDGAITVAERIRLANRLIGATMPSSHDAVAAMLASDDPWLKSCGLSAIVSLGLTAMQPQLEACLEHPDPQLRQAARNAKTRLGSTKSV